MGDAEPGRGYWLRRDGLGWHDGKLVEYWRCLGPDWTATMPFPAGDCRDWIRHKADELRHRFRSLHLRLKQ